MNAVELASQVERVVVAVVEVADRMGDLRFPAADRLGIDGVDPALEVAGVAVGRNGVGSWAEEAAVVVGHAVGGSPDDYCFAKLVGEHVIEAPQAWRKLRVATDGVGEGADALGASVKVVRPVGVAAQGGGDAGQPRERAGASGFERVSGVCAKEPLGGGGDGVGVPAHGLVQQRSRDWWRGRARWSPTPRRRRGR